MSADTGQLRPLDHAAWRLEQALARLEQRLAARLTEAGAKANDAMDQDRTRLAGQLDQSRARERELEEAGAEASAALSRAITEIRAALGRRSQ